MVWLEAGCPRCMIVVVVILKDGLLCAEVL